MKIFSPKEFMKSRRPEKFSDSFSAKKSQLNRSVLEYHLDTLGNRNQEHDFAEFVRKLCQLEICPNLRPQTGSVGGGDRKVDSETLPVTSQKRLTYYEGSDNQNSELWGFAFSTQKTWKAKVVDDVEKAVKTGREYKKIIFVTSEFVRDKDGAEFESKLSKKHNCKVLILDRSWILDKVFASEQRQNLAIDELKMGDSLKEEKGVGPLDFQRTKRVTELEKKIEDAVSNGVVNLSIVDKALDCALLAVRLGQPQVEVEGLFDRSIRMAEEYGIEEQVFTAIYQKAWAIFFWFEDYRKFSDLYNKVEEKALISNNVFSVERLNNLWNILHVVSVNSSLEYITPQIAESKKENLIKKLKEITLEETKPSAAVQAEAMICFIELMSLKERDSEIDGIIFKRLSDTLEKADQLIGFPFDSISGILNEMNDFFSKNVEYEALLEKLIVIETKRKGEIPAAELLLRRGVQHLEKGDAYKAIDNLGRALIRFYKHESKNDLVRTLFYLSIAYNDAGLLWAARGVLLNAASYSMAEFWEQGKVTKMQIACIRELKKIELQLGRVGYVLEWFTVYRAMLLQLIETEEERSDLLDESIKFGALLGMLIIHTPDNKLKELERLPETLIKMDLDYAAFGLIYRLSGDEFLPEGFLKDMSQEERRSFFNSWLTQPAQEDISHQPAYYTEEIVSLRSIVLGCEFIVEVPNSSPEIEIGEYILSAFESFISTAMELNAISRDSSVLIKIERDENIETEITYDAQINQNCLIVIKSKNFNPHSISVELSKKISKIISDIVMYLIANSVIFHDTENDLLKLFRDEEAINRAFSFTTPLVTLGNLLGYSPKRSILDWIDKDEKIYLYIPEKSIKPAYAIIKDLDKDKSGEDGSSILRHTDIKNISIIKQHLWNNAGWNGILYLSSPDSPPIISLFFENKENAEVIFNEWRDIFGKEDKKEIIEISIIQGISKENPSWYQVSIGANLNQKQSSENRIIVVNRVHTMNPETSKNLDTFLEAYNKFGVYFLTVAFRENGKTDPTILFDKTILKRSLNIKIASEVSNLDLVERGVSE